MFSRLAADWKWLSGPDESIGGGGGGVELKQTGLDRGWRIGNSLRAHSSLFKVIADRYSIRNRFEIGRFWYSFVYERVFPVSTLMRTQNFNPCKGVVVSDQENNEGPICALEFSHDHRRRFQSSPCLPIGKWIIRGWSSARRVGRYTYPLCGRRWILTVTTS